MTNLEKEVSSILRRCLETYDNCDAPARGGPLTLVQATQEIVKIVTREQRNGRR